MNIVICQFAKAPVLGRVKTRLTPEYSPEQALAIHSALVEDTVKRLSPLQHAEPEGGRVSYQLWYSDADKSFDRLAREYGVSLRQQVGSDLGQRLAHCAEQNAKSGAAVILIGSDCPYLTCEQLREAMDAWRAPEVDATVIPAADGGYVMLGIKRFSRNIFQDITWGSAKVLEQTLRKCAEEKMQVSVLPALQDIDYPADFKSLCETRTEFSTLLAKS
ncbi:2-phospho-L-lactate guanylyltransferase [Thalassocella blandensis]|nr:2-phospho-L-lactate guanylyltransferase [Thalassocella blandensis]